MARDVSNDFPLTPQEQLDSDEVRNADGDEVVDPPESWIDAGENETLDERLAEEEPDVAPAAVDPREAGDTQSLPDDELDRIDPEQHGINRGQVDGSPEDGDSFFDVQN